MPSAGQRRLIFTGNVKTSNNNKYRPGSGIGGLNASVRRHKYKRASTYNLTLAQLENDYKARKNGTPISYPKMNCCSFSSTTTNSYNPSNLLYNPSQTEQVLYV